VAPKKDLGDDDDDLGENTAEVQKREKKKAAKGK
jgi:hypothetical protein